MRKGLNDEVICQAAAALVAEKGYRNFSLRELASRLGVAPSSLYEHIDGVDGICTKVGLQAIDRLSTALDEAIDVDDRDEAFIRFAHAYRTFAHENPELYRAIIGIPKADDEMLAENEFETIAPLRKIVERFVSTKDDVIDFQRFVRSGLHGFVALEDAGFMRAADVLPDKSYDMLVHACLDTLKHASDVERENAGHVGNGRAGYTENENA